MEIKVGECRLERGLMVRVDEDVDKVVNMMLQHHYVSLPVVDREGNFVGVVNLLDLLGRRGVVGEYVKAATGYVEAGSTLYEAWEVMSKSRSTWAPVVEKGKLVGVITMESMRVAYDSVLHKVK
jgi:CIC family chloride channel protein